MKKSYRFVRRGQILLVIILIGLAGILHGNPGILGIFEPYHFLLERMIYIGILIRWGISINKRVVLKQPREALLWMVAFCIARLVLQTCKYAIFAPFPDIVRYCWYAYVVPTVFIPLMSYFAAEDLDYSEIRKSDRTWWLLSAFLFIIAAFTNDWHQKFTFFPNGVENWQIYRDGWIRIAMYVWLFGLACLTLRKIWQAGHFRETKKWIWLPVLWIVLLLVYELTYHQGPFFLSRRMFQNTEMVAFAFVALWESCFELRLTQVNDLYEAYFNHFSYGAAVADMNDTPIYTSRAYRPVNAAAKQAARLGPVILPGHYRLRCIPIRGGHLFWQDHLERLHRAQEELSEDIDLLEERIEVQQAENSAREAQVSLAEEIRLYDSIMEFLAPELERMKDLLEQAQNASGAEQKRLLAYIGVYGAYVKRRSNLILIKEDTDLIDGQELALSIAETLRALGLLGIHTQLNSLLEGPMDPVVLLAFYDYLEEIAERYAERLKVLRVSLYERHETVSMRLEVRPGISMVSPPARIKMNVTESGDETVVRLWARKGRRI